VQTTPEGDRKLQEFESDKESDKGVDDATVSAAVGSKRTQPTTVSDWSPLLYLNVPTAIQLARELCQASEASFCLSAERPSPFGTSRATKKTKHAKYGHIL
jgi:hypothetical protein